MKVVPVILIVFSWIFLSFSNKKNKVNEFNLNDFEKSLMSIPMGAFDFWRISNITMDTSKSKSIVIESFYICNHEVTNKEYVYFLTEIKNTNQELYQKMLPDTLVWRSKRGCNEPYVEYYLRHPAYFDYPVVGVSYEQAEYYRTWLTKKYMSERLRKFKDVKFKLPNVKQWIYSAMGGRTDVIFPWIGYAMQNKEGKWLANFKVIPQSEIGFYNETIKKDSEDLSGKLFFPANQESSQSFLNADLTCSVFSYYPNNYGLYNMAGNVKEYVEEVGITKGGGWSDTGIYLQNVVEQKYDSVNYTSDDTGFRFVMEVTP